jgi:hypothetical protein
MIRRFALLQAFVAVARAGKMKRATNELALTPGAVSQRRRYPLSRSSFDARRSFVPRVRYRLSPQRRRF